MYDWLLSESYGLVIADPLIEHAIALVDLFAHFDILIPKPKVS